MREEIRLEVSFAAARTGLARLAHGRLLDVSQTAYGDGLAGLARVGPRGSARGISKLVRVHVGEVMAHADSASLPLRWEATGPGTSLFPALDADITLTAIEEQATTLALAGVYRPPLGAFGAGLDHAVLGRVATATIRTFTASLAKAIAADAPGHEPLGHRPGRA